MWMSLPRSREGNQYALHQEMTRSLASAESEIKPSIKYVSNIGRGTLCLMAQ